MAMIGRNQEMTWREVMGLVMALVPTNILIVSAQGFSEKPEEWIYSRLQHDNPHRYVFKDRSIWSVDEAGRIAARMWTLAPEPMALCVANGQTGAVEWTMSDDDRITFRLWNSRAVYRLMPKGDHLEPVLVYKGGPAWCLESDSLCWNFADRLAERVTRERRMAAAERAA